MRGSVRRDAASCLYDDGLYALGYAHHSAAHRKERGKLLPMELTATHPADKLLDVTHPRRSTLRMTGVLIRKRDRPFVPAVCAAPGKRHGVAYNRRLRPYQAANSAFWAREGNSKADLHFCFCCQRPPMSMSPSAQHEAVHSWVCCRSVHSVCSSTALPF